MTHQKYEKTQIWEFVLLIWRLLVGFRVAFSIIVSTFNMKMKLFTVAKGYIWRSLKVICRQTDSKFAWSSAGLTCPSGIQLLLRFSEVLVWLILWGTLAGEPHPWGKMPWISYKVFSHLQVNIKKSYCVFHVY